MVVSAVAVLVWGLHPAVGRAQAVGVPSAGPASQVPLAVQRDPLVEARELRSWLMRVHEAAQTRNYAGVFVVSAGGQIASSRILHVVDGGQQFERIDSMDGQRRLIFRHNDWVHTLMPESRHAVVEQRESMRALPGLLRSDSARLAEHYELRQLGVERVAGFEANVLHLRPRDGLRYGYKLWAEKATGLLLKCQTLGLQGEVLEQAAFSELTLNIPRPAEKLSDAMNKLDGYRVDRPTMTRTTAQAEGWALKQELPGFRSVGYVRRAQVGQWIFSDGLATVSVFMEPVDGAKPRREGQYAIGATHGLTRRLGDTWVTALGEVPQETLRGFVNQLERKR
jgi:sigma-E factor negative regulatory protein RseB